MPHSLLPLLFCLVRATGRSDGRRVAAFGDCRGMAERGVLVGQGREHGLQFKAATMKTVPPPTAEAILWLIGCRCNIQPCGQKCISTACFTRYRRSQ